MLLRQAGLWIIGLYLLGMAPAALAQSRNVVLWDPQIRAEIDRRLVSRNTCRAGHYVFSEDYCTEFALNADDSRYMRLHELDRLLLFVNRYKDLRLNADLRRNIKLKFVVGLTHFYEQEARARVTLRIRF